MAEQLIFPAGVCEIQAAAETGKLARVEILAYTGGLMKVPGWGLVAIDLAGLDASGQIAILADHDATRRGLVGHGVAMIRDGRVHVSGTASAPTEASREIIAAAKNGFQWQASVGVDPHRSEYIQAGEAVSVNGKTIKSDQDFAIIRASKLREVSITAMGADAGTSVSIAARKGTTMDQDNTNATIPAQATPNQPAPSNTPIMASAGVAADSPLGLRAEAARLAIIDRCVASYTGRIEASQLAAFKARAISEGWNENETELQLLRAERPAPPAIYSSSFDVKSKEVLEASLVLRMNESIAQKSYKPETLDAARLAGPTNMVDLCRGVLAMTGRQTPSNRDEMLRAAFSTSDLSGILSNAAGKMMLNAYQAFPSVARIVARKLSASDFKQHTGYRMVGDTTFKRVTKGGEITHGTFSDQAYPYQVDTFARMFTITRQDAINDDLNALDEIPRFIGRGAATALEELFWALVLANTKSFFSAGHKNYLEGADMALSSESLSVAVQAFLEQTDANGKPINVLPTWLVVPPSLKTTADALYASKTVAVGGGSTTASDAVPNGNPFFGLYQPLTTPYLSNEKFHASASATAWYLFGNAADVAAFGIAYLNGMESPTVEQVKLPAEVLGIGWRGYVDIGVCQIDYCGAEKVEGTAA